MKKNINMRHSLKYRMALATALVATLVLVVSAGFSQYYAYESLKGLLQDQQDTRVKMVAEQLDEKLESREVVLRRLAKQLEPALARPATELRRLATGAVDMPESFNAVLMAWPDGTLAFSTAVPEGYKANVSEREYFRAILRGAPFVVSDLIQGRYSNSPGVILAVPLHGPKGELRAVVAGVLNLNGHNFLRELSRSRVGVTGYYCLVSAPSNPRYALHPVAGTVLQPARAEGESCGAEQPKSAWEWFAPKQPIVARHALEANGWQVVAVLPAQEAFSPLIEIRQRAVIAGVMSLLVAGALMWLLIRHILAPLEHLHRTVRQLATRPTAVAELQHDSEDEIGELATAFSEVMHQLSERERALEAAKDRADASEKRMEAIANHVPDYVSFIDASERFAYVNQAYANHFGLAPAQIVGLTLRELWGTSEYVANEPFLAQARAGEAVTVTRECADGAWFEVTYQPAWNEARDALTGLHMFARNVTDERARLRQLEAQTLSDHLTGLLNRKGFDRRLADVMARADANGQRAALLLVDLDDFKAVNDTHGHAIGDRLLVAFAERLSHCVRKGDAVARIGGDEFAIILENVGHPGTVDRLARTVVQAALRPLVIGDQPFVATASVGSALHQPHGGSSISELFMRADMALYEAKRCGKARHASPTAPATFTV